MKGEDTFKTLKIIYYRRRGYSVKETGMEAGFLSNFSVTLKLNPSK